VYADASHAWVVIAGIAFDTANYGGPNIPSGNGPRWRTDPTGNLFDGAATWSATRRVCDRSEPPVMA